MPCVRCGTMSRPTCICAIAYALQRKRAARASHGTSHWAMTNCAGRSGQEKPSEANNLACSCNVCVASSCAASGDPGFDVNVVSQERDEEMLNRARIEWKEPKNKTGRLQPLLAFNMTIFVILTHTHNTLCGACSPSNCRRWQINF